MLLFIGLFASAFVALGRVARRALQVSPAGSDVSRLAQCLLATLVGFAVGAFFLSLAYADMLYMLMALTIALAQSARAREAARPAFVPRYGPHPS